MNSSLPSISDGKIEAKKKSFHHPETTVSYCLKLHLDAQTSVLDTRVLKVNLSVDLFIGSVTMSGGLVFALLCAIVAILYGVFSIKWILGKSAGNEKMRGIAAAIQEGASAYLNRQYTTIGIVGAILVVGILVPLKSPR